MECCQCRLQWYDRPGHYATYKHCPRCFSLYWIWITYQGRNLENCEGT